MGRCIMSPNISLPQSPDQKKAQWRSIAKVFGAWILFSAILSICLPNDNLLIKIFPIAMTFGMILFTLTIAAIGIFLRRIGFFKPRYALVNHTRISSCILCPNRLIEDNPVNAKIPICKCKDKGMRLIFNPNKVPRWCPHAIV